MQATSFDAAAATNRLGLEIFREILATQSGANVVVSPYSIHTALALAFVGACGKTRAEIIRALSLPDDNAAVEAGFGALRSGLEALVATSTKEAEFASRYGGKQDPIVWRLANRLFGQTGYPFRADFCATLRDRFGSPLEALDFHRAPNEARLRINAWVAEQTADRIRDLIADGQLGRDTRLVLVNALYLKAPWSFPFPTEKTKPAPFHFVDGTAADVPTMRHVAHYGYAKEPHATVVTLPYVDPNLQFVIVLPHAGVDLQQVIEAIEVPVLARWAKLEATALRIDLLLPKLRVESPTIELGTTLQKLGIRRAFDEPPQSADFDAIAPRRAEEYLFLSSIVHRTFVAVDEQGIEAAAATALVTRGGAAFRPAPPIAVRVDRPFLFIIQHRPTSTCLFLGQIKDPRFET